VSKFAGGLAQADYMSRIGQLPPQQCLVVPIDVGKSSATALVVDHHGRIVQDLFEFDLTVSGANKLITVVAAAEQRAGALSVRAGIESAGHYHRALATTLRDKGFDIVELNPYHVKMARAQMGQARIKTDLRDCLSMAEVLVRGRGWGPHSQDGTIAEQRLWTARRRRKLAAAQVLGGQIHALADLAFPGLTGCFTTGLEAKTLRMLLATLAEPAAVAGMDANALVAHAATHRVRMLRPKARQVIAAARDAMCVPEAQRRAAQQLLAEDVATFDALQQALVNGDVHLEQLLPHTPAGVLTSVPGIGVVTASYYGAALGDPDRFANADAAYRYSGLTPTSYESAGRKATNNRISKVGSVELRQAIITLGTVLALHHPDFAAHKRRLLAAGKRPIVAAIALGHRAHRLAFALMRAQQPYDPRRWQQGQQGGRLARTTARAARTT